jgi:hypothetical protein
MIRNLRCFSSKNVDRVFRQARMGFYAGVFVDFSTSLAYGPDVRVPIPPGVAQDRRRPSGDETESYTLESMASWENIY